MTGERVSAAFKSLKAELTDDEKKEREKEYEALFALFLTFLKNLGNELSREEALEELAELRAELAISHLFRGLNIDEDDALQLLENIDDDNLTQEDKDKRAVIIAGINNLIEFAVCEEYQLSERVDEYIEDNELDHDDLDYEDEELMDELGGLCHLYNDTYAAVENGDIEYAAGMALGWIHYEENQYLTYMTQNDDRVRPWHFVLQGFTARKSEFPEWMIPPIEWGCRCFLETSGGDVYAKGSKLKDVKAKAPAKPSQLDDVFSESLCKCGRIFGKSHPYFDVKEKDVAMLDGFVKKIKEKYYGRH